MNPAMGSDSPARELLARFAARITAAISRSPHHVPLFLQFWPRQAWNESQIATTGSNAPIERRPSELQISHSARKRSAMHHQPAPLKSRIVAAASKIAVTPSLSGGNSAATSRASGPDCAVADVVGPYSRFPKRFRLRRRMYTNGNAAPAAPNAASMIEGFSGESTHPPNAEAIDVERTIAIVPET